MPAGKNSLKTVETEKQIVEFAASCGGFPSSVKVKSRDGNIEVIRRDEPMLAMELGDGHRAAPFLPEGFQVFETVYEGAKRLEFRKIPWRDDAGAVLDDFHLSLRYEFLDDGTVFADTFFFIENINGPGISGFKMNVPLSLRDYEQPRWGFIGRLEHADNVTGLFGRLERFLEPGNDQTFPGEIIPIFSFEGRGKHNPAAHFELFMEGNNTLSGKIADAETQISWNANSPEICWNFQKNLATKPGRTWQWQNQWGWVMTAAPVIRRFPPLRMYHFFDNFKRYPTERQVDLMAEAGADLLVMHENWRIDPQNGGEPYDPVIFERLINAVHRHGIRVALYIRGNEIAAQEEFCDWFDSLLQKDFDGIYMDFGGAYSDFDACGKNLYGKEASRFPDGRVFLKRYYRKLCELRRRVGSGGVLLSHTGPTFSALGMTGGKVDGYVAGEGEMGVMVKGRPEHEYYSGTFAVNGTMWTAAFPAYGTARMIPFLAVAGQSPHVAQGTQFLTSSLAHPEVPGISDVYLRALWKLWGLFKGEKHIDFLNDYNSFKVLSHADADTGGCLMISSDKRLALLILTDFSGKQHTVKTTVDFAKAGFDVSRAKCWRLTPDCDKPGPAEEYAQCQFETKLDGYGVAGFLFSCDEGDAARRLEIFAQPYPSLSAEAKAYIQKIEQQRRFRDYPTPRKKLYCQIHAPPAMPIAYEDAMVDDLYDSTHQLGILDSSDNFTPLGHISLKGLSSEQPSRADSVTLGKYSDWMPLHELLKPGEYRLAVKTIHRRCGPFYSFVYATLSPSPNASDPEAFTLRFANELEDQFDRIHWKVNLIK